MGWKWQISQVYRSEPNGVGSTQSVGQSGRPMRRPCTSRMAYRIDGSVHMLTLAVAIFLHPNCRNELGETTKIPRSEEAYG